MLTKKNLKDKPKTKNMQAEAAIISSSSPGLQQRAARQIIFTHKLFGGAVFRANKNIPAQRGNNSIKKGLIYNRTI